MAVELPSFESLQKAAEPPRAFDLYVLGPLLILSGLKKTPLSPWMRRSLLISGGYLVLKNWKSYLALKEAVTPE